MKISRKKAEYTPIKIVLETRKEAKIFFSIIEKIDDEYMDCCHLSNREKDMIIELSDYFIMHGCATDE